MNKPARFFSCFFFTAIVTCSVGCGESGNQSISENVTVDERAEYKKMIAEEEAKMSQQPPETAE